MMGSNNSHKTAIRRNKISRPTQTLIDNNVIKGNVLDYGCGHGYDAETMGFDKYDPFFFPNGLDKNKKYDTIICNYVLNVLNCEQEKEVIADIRKRLKKGGCAYLSVRRDKFTEGINKKGTYQRSSHPNLDVYFKKSGSFEIYTLKH